MAEVSSVDLRGKVPSVGPIHFLRAEWQVPRSRFVIVRYGVNDHEERPYGIRLDLDKRAILDDIEGLDAGMNSGVKARAENIWQLVITFRQERREIYA